MMRKFFIAYVAIFHSINLLQSYPSSLFWTNCSTEICEPGQGFLEIGKYQKVVHRRGKGTAIPTDYGITYGIGQLKQICFEAGLDILTAKDVHPYLNAKAGVAEGILGSECPSLSLGISDVGIKTHGSFASNQNIVNLIFGKTIPCGVADTFYVGGFKGTRLMGKNRIGAMFGLSKNFLPQKTMSGRMFHTIVFLADYATGKNSIGGGGFGISYYCTPNIFFQTGPVWFSDKKINGRWKWSFILHVNIP